MTTEKITSLTKEQEAKLPVYRDMWLKIGLSTERANRAEAERGAELAYAAAGLKAPARRIWCDGPTQGARTAAELLGTTPNQALSQCFWSQHEAGWLSYQDFFFSELKLECSKPIEGLLTIAKSCGWVWFMDEAIVFTERPLELHRDNEHRLHCQTGPAISYADGTKLYNWHGVAVPEAWILKPNEMKPEDALTWQNVEQRRAAAEIMGWSKILDKLNARTIDRDEDPQIGELLEADLPDAPNERFLRVRCGTGRTFCLPVPKTVKTALEANAWTFGFEDVKSIENFRDYEVRT